MAVAIATAPSGAKSFDQGSVQRVLSGMSCAHCDLSEAYLKRADLAGINLTGTVLDGANLKGVLQ